MSMAKLMEMNGAVCSCGRPHRFDAKVAIGAGAVERLPEFINDFGAKKAFLLSDRNTWTAAAPR